MNKSIILIIASIFCLTEMAYAGINDGLVAYYPFDGNANDVSGSGNNGTENGGVTYKDGVLGKAASFDGIDDYIDVADSETLDINGSGMTISAWVMPNQNDAYHAIVSKYFGEGYYLRVDPGGKINFYALGTLETNTAVVPTGKFTHIVGTFDGTNAFIYANGQLVTSGQTVYPGPGLIRPTDFPITIGAWTISHDKKFNGVIDEVRIYNRYFSKTEIQELYSLNGLPPVPEPSTKVPVHNGLWLIPGILTGLYLLRRRKKPSA